MYKRQITSLGFTKVSKRHVAYRQIKFTVTKTINRQGNKSVTEGISELGSRHVLTFYGSKPILNQIFFKGNVVNIAFKKAGKYKTRIYINDPIIVPNGMQLVSRDIPQYRKRDIPTQLYYNAYYEFMYRYSLDKK